MFRWFACLDLCLSFPYVLFCWVAGFVGFCVDLLWLSFMLCEFCIAVCLFVFAGVWFIICFVFALVLVCLDCIF